ncbi:MAG TPA: hypothetical protein VMF31_10565 [Solirubrobacterales bacterium]|nr:hypothetical protein [Solirubrobacterales bacterium]
MANEGLKIKLPGAGGAELDLNGSIWGLFELNLGNGAKRDEMVASTDANGALPARIPFRDNREVTARLQLRPQSTMDLALTAVGTLESFLEQAEVNAGAQDPAIDTVRFIYQPAGSTKSFTLPIYQASIEDVPKVVEGGDAGFFLKAPVVLIKASCDPYGYGALRTYLDTTTSAAAIAPSVTIPGGPGDAPPWLRMKVKDVSSRLRGRLVVGLRRREAGVNPTVLASAMTPIAGTIASGFMFGTSADWSVVGQVPRESRLGTFRFYLMTAFGSGQARLCWAEAGGSRRSLPAVDVGGAGVADILLGSVSAKAPWDAWIETKGDVRFFSRTIIPNDCLIEATGPMAGRQLAGAGLLTDDLATVSTHIGSRTGWTAAGSHNASPSWPVSVANGATRTVVSMTAPAFAYATGINALEADLRFRTKTIPGGSFSVFDFSKPFQGGFVRWKNTTNFLVAGWALNGTFSGKPGLWACIGGVYYLLWMGPATDVMNPWFTLFGGYYEWRIQTTLDGRWYVSVEARSTVTAGVFWSATASGAHGALIQGEDLGDPANARVGLYDNYSYATPGLERRSFGVQASSLAGVTPPPIPTDGTLTLDGPTMLTSGGAEYLYAGSSGLTIAPGVDNNLTLFARRSAGRHKDSSTGNTDPLDIDIEGHPRYLTVPH